MTIDGRLLLVGCGKMGGALLRGWLDRGVPPQHVTVVEPYAAPLEDLRARGVSILPDATGLPADLKPAVILLAVKPQMMDDALPPYRRFVSPGTVFLSIAAGKTVAYFHRHLGDKAYFPGHVGEVDEATPVAVLEAFLAQHYAGSFVPPIIVCVIEPQAPEALSSLVEQAGKPVQWIRQPQQSRRRWLEQNVAAGDVELSAEVLAQLEATFPPGAAAGDRYHSMASVNG